MRSSSFLLACLLPLAVLAGCVDPNTDDTQDTCFDWSEWWTIVHSQAPFGWTATHRLAPSDNLTNGEDLCVDSNVCDTLVDGDVNTFQDNDLDRPGYNTLFIRSGDHKFLCVSREFYIDQYEDMYETIDLSGGWDEEGICGLAPDGEYGNFNVSTNIRDHDGTGDKVWISIDGMIAIVTNNTFFYEDDVYLLEGNIANDLSEIYFHDVYKTTGLEDYVTIYLQD